jgi:hypothetical protein
MIRARERIPLVPAIFAELADWRRGYRELRAARWQAQDQGRDPNNHPLSLPQLRERGVPDQFLVLMLYHGHVRQFRPAVRPRSGRLRPEPANSLHLRANSLFALTEAGEAFADRLLRTRIGGEALRTTWNGYCPARLVPHYDPIGRVFRWGCHDLKRFRQPALNQELVLLTAQELNWPEWFDDPLPVQSGTNPKVRLHDTIKSLNHWQVPHLVRFKGDGTGTRIGWEYC